MPPHQRLLAAFFKALFRRSVRQGLRGVWVKGDPPREACVLAGNHHSWWDSYLLPVLFWQQRQPFGIVVGERRMREFGFFHLLGAVSAAKPREALAVLKRGDILIVFPEGELRAPGGLGDLNKGTVWFAEKAGVGVVPVASRVALRGQEFPEAYLVFGEPVGADLGRLEAALNQMLAELDAQIRTAPAEQPLPGFRLETPGRKSTHERMAFWGEMLGRLTGR